MAITNYWEVWADADGGLNIEHHIARWEFTTKGPVGRPPKPTSKNPCDLFPPDIIVQRLTINGL